MTEVEAAALDASTLESIAAGDVVAAAGMVGAGDTACSDGSDGSGT